MDKIKIIIAFLIITVGAAIVGFWLWQNFHPSQYDDFAKCLSDKGVKFYGAFWCSHCQAEKALFGNAKRFLPYVECSTPDGNRELQTCIDKGVTSYPTWVFPDGTTQVGEMSLQELAGKSGCALP